MLTRRQILISALASFTGGTLLKKAEAASQKNQSHTHSEPSSRHKRRGPYTPVVTPNGHSLPYKMKNGVKEFHLTAEPVEREFAPDMKVKCWGYNGQTPGPTIEAVEGDRVRIFVTNKLREHTSIHWHGIFLPNGMDGVGGLTQPHIKPGETYEVRAKDTAKVDHFRVALEAPEDLGIVTVDGVAAGEQPPVVSRARNVELVWEGDGYGDEVIATLNWTSMGMPWQIICRMRDDGLFIIPWAVTTRLPDPLTSTDEEIGLQRIRQVAFRSANLASGTFKFIVSTSFPVSF